MVIKGSINIPFTIQNRTFKGKKTYKNYKNIVKGKKVKVKGKVVGMGKGCAEYFGS
jgi:hypothetical protein